MVRRGKRYVFYEVLQPYYTQNAYPVESGSGGLTIKNRNNGNV